jgi:hypothetical protein
LVSIARVVKRGLLYGVAGALIALLAALAFSSAESQCQSAQHAYRANAAKEHGSGEVTDLAFDRPWLPCLVKRATAEDQARDAGEHDNRDLAAQEASAGIAFWQLVVGIFGTVGLIGTLFLNYRAIAVAAHSADAAHDSNRPWLRLTVTLGDMRISPEGHLLLKVKMERVNHGNSPASNVVPFARLVHIEGTNVIPFHIGRDTAFAIFKRWKGGIKEFGKTVFPGLPDESDETAFSEKGLAATLARQAVNPILVLVTGLSYRFRGVKRCTVETFIVAMGDAQAFHDLIKDRKLDAHRLILVEHPSSYVT